MTIDWIILILLGILYITVALFTGILAIILLSLPVKIVYRIYHWFFTSYGQMAKLRYEQGDFTDYENYWPWSY